MSAQSIRTVAFRFKPEISNCPHECMTLSFPEQWYQLLKELAAKKYNRTTDKAALPSNSLNAVIRALASDVIYIQGKVNPDKPWLYSMSSIDAETLVNVVHAWAKHHFAEVDTLNSVLAQIRPDAVQWQKTELNLAQWDINPNGTAHPKESHFILLPDFIAATISHLGRGMQYGDFSLNWKRASLGVGKSGTELISWPPLEHVTDRHTERYSVVLTFTVQTVPFQTYPVIHCDTSIRRWVTRSDNVPSFHRSSVYILSQSPYLAGSSGLEQQFQVARIRSRKIGEKQYEAYWCDDLVPILANLKVAGMPFDADDFRQNPLLGMNDRPPVVAMVHSDRLFKGHSVGKGVTIRERSHLVTQVLSLLDNYFEFVPEPKYVSMRSKRKTLETELDIHDALHRTVGSQLAIEVYGTPEIRQALLKHLYSTLKIEPPVQHPAKLQANAVTLLVSEHELVPDIHAELELDAGRSRAADQVEAAVSQRIAAIKRLLAPAAIPTLVLSELTNKKQFKFRPKHDPKAAIRLGFAATRRLVQFIASDPIKSTHDNEVDEEENSKETSLDHRAKQSVLDGLRQLGIANPLPAVKGLPEPLTVIGLWIIRRNRAGAGTKPIQFPVWVRIDSATNQIYARTTGFDDWLPYREALLKLATLDQGNERINPNQDLRPILKGFATKDTLLLCDAHNIRSVWSFMANTQIQQDALSFDSRGNFESLAQWPNLRIVRIRGNQGHETPESYAEQTKGLSAASGIFQVNSRVFASLHTKPVQFSKISHYASKAERFIKNGKSYYPNIKNPTWNPALYELTVSLLQHADHVIYQQAIGDDGSEDRTIAANWAYYVHLLRKEQAFHFTEATMLPLPLHLAKLMDEYVRRIEIDDEDEAN